MHLCDAVCQDSPTLLTKVVEIQCIYSAGTTWIYDGHSPARSHLLVKLVEIPSLGVQGVPFFAFLPNKTLVTDAFTEG